MRLRYFVYFREQNGYEWVFGITSRTLLGAKQYATKLLKSDMSKFSIETIKIEDRNLTVPFWIAHKFVGSKKWSSLV